MSEASQLFNLATRVINHTNRHLFLTGKAGTGKTTFLRNIVQTTPKKTIVVAPTGVAAINAGGVTMHSFFQLPLGMYLPDAQQYFGAEYSGQMVTNRHSLFKNLRMQRDKIALIRELELVIIDEVSMLRADMLDAIDAVLRHFRRKENVPFGGVQMLFIGDLFQLPPVVTNGEAALFFENYPSPFFFSAQVLQQDFPMVVELRHIFRQRDEQFISILNGIRNNSVSEEDLAVLHQRFEPWTQPEDGVIVLTTHNHKADAINAQKLAQLPGESNRFDAAIKGEFSERALPVDRSLELKIGAQVMFIKNDTGEQRKFYNGKLAKVFHIGTEGDVWVRLAQEPGSTDQALELKLEQHTWRNIRYQYNQDKDEVEEEELGSFSQFPIRLAWAITIHKSQGLTFDRAIIDAGQSFAAGQVYVALSRLTSISGLILHSRISIKGIEMPEVVLEFCKQAIAAPRLEEILKIEEHHFAQEQLLNWFSLEKETEAWSLFYSSYASKGMERKLEARAWCGARIDVLERMLSTSKSFRNQLKRYMYPQPDYKSMQERVHAAKDWFDQQLQAGLLQPIRSHYQEYMGHARSKKYLKELQELEAQLLNLKKRWQQAQQLVDGLASGVNMGAITFDTPREESGLSDLAALAVKKENEKPKSVKGASFKASLELFRAGNSVAEIAQQRGFTEGTIYSHLTQFIASGEVSLEEFMKPEEIELIKEAYQELGAAAPAGTIKESLPSFISYTMIRMVGQALRSGILADTE